MRPRLCAERTMCTEIASEVAIRSGLLTRRAPLSWALASREVRTPRNDVHVQRSAVAGHASPQAAETDDAERLSGKAPTGRHAALEAARAHGRIGEGDGARGGNHEAEGQFGGGEGSAWAAACGVANDNALPGAGGEVQRRYGGPRNANHAQFRQTADERLRKSGALAHGEQDVEIGQRRRRPRPLSQRRWQRMSDRRGRRADASSRCRERPLASHRVWRFWSRSSPARAFEVAKFYMGRYERGSSGGSRRTGSKPNAGSPLFLATLSQRRPPRAANFFQAFSKLFANFRVFSASFSKLSFGGFGGFQRLRGQKIWRAPFSVFSKFFVPTGDGILRKGGRLRRLSERTKPRFSFVKQRKRTLPRVVKNRKKISDVFGLFFGLFFGSCCSNDDGRPSRCDRRCF